MHVCGEKSSSDESHRYSGWSFLACRLSSNPETYLEQTELLQDVVDITDSIVTWINEKTLKYRYLCMTLAVDEVVEATKFASSLKFHVEYSFSECR